MGNWHPVESGLDSLLSHIGGGPFGVLDYVRGAMHGVLHPFAAATDWGLNIVEDGVQGAIGFAGVLYGYSLDYAGRIVHDLGQWTAAGLEGLGHLANQWFHDALDFAGRIVHDVYQWTGMGLDVLRGLASRWVHDALDFAARVAADVQHWAGMGLDVLRGLAERWFHDALDFAGRIVHDLEQWAAAGLHTLADWAARLVADAERLAAHLAQGAVDFARAALGAFYRDVIAPIERDLARLGYDLMHWAKPLLDIVEAAAHWIVWVTERAVPDVLRAWVLVFELDPTDMPSMMSAFAGYQATDGRALAAAYRN